MFTIVVTKVTGRAGDSLLAGTMFLEVTEVVGRQAALDYLRGYADDPLKSSPAMQKSEIAISGFQELSGTGASFGMYVMGAQEIS